MMHINQNQESQERFITNFYEFYGPHGAHPMNIDRNDISIALNIVQNDVEIPYVGDAVDRERVKDVLINSMGFQFLSQ
jgi:hypothetical protein